MLKKEIAEFVSRELGITVGEAKAIVQKVLDTILKTVAAEGRVELRDFGVFEVQRRAAYRARNPRTGERVDVPAKHVATFKPGRIMQQRIEGGPRRHDNPSSDEASAS